MLQNTYKVKSVPTKCRGPAQCSPDWIIQAALGLLQLLPGKPTRLHQTPSVSMTMGPEKGNIVETIPGGPARGAALPTSLERIKMTIILR